MGSNVWHSISKVAAADLRTKQFYGVKLDSAGKIVLCSAAGESVLGVLGNKPNTGEVGSVDVAGIVQVIAGGVIAPGGKVKVSAAGKFVAASAGTTNTGDAGAASDPLIGSYVFGEYLGVSNAADGDIIDVLVTREGAIPTTAA